MPVTTFGIKTSHTVLIRQMNQFLSMQETIHSTFPEDKNLKWEAQVRFFRAYVYFQLAKRHGGVILYDDLPGLMIKHGVRQLKHGSSLQMIWTLQLPTCQKNGMRPIKAG
ncbi:hypothetical protein NXV35_25455 [Bacteroides faecis]|nr:hypothetical protein [Bacteroides faecis]